MKSIKIGTRQSQLALWQANMVRNALVERYPDRAVELVKIVSAGDKTLDVPLAQIGGKGLFLKELEEALLSEEVDLAVHSMKDVTVSLPDGLHMPAFCPREDPRDAFVSNHHASLGSLPAGAIIGTCSLRRQSQLRAAYPHLDFRNLRGNVNTRLTRLDQGEYDGIILAVAGLKRLGLKDRIRQEIDPVICLPAAGQGVIGIECRIGDQRMNELIEPLNDRQSAVLMRAERAANACLGGGCQAPVAVHGELSDGHLRLRGMVGTVDGSRILRTECSGPAGQACQLGQQLAKRLISQGADHILQSVYG